MATKIEGFQSADFKRWPHMNRRSGRTCLLISMAIVDLLARGECVLTDHTIEGKYPDSFAGGWLLRKLKTALCGVLDCDKRQLEDAFTFKPNKDGYGPTIWVTAKNLHENANGLYE